MDDYERTDETRSEKLDRNWNELLQELRVSQTGVQILTGFLLTLPVQPSFRDLGGFERGSYVVAVSASIVATCLLIAPVAMHRLLFRQRRKESIVRVGDIIAKLGLAILALAIAAVVSLVFSIVYGRSTGIAGGAVALLMFAGAWLVLPLWMRERGKRTAG